MFTLPFVVLAAVGAFGLHFRQSIRCLVGLLRRLRLFPLALRLGFSLHLRRRHRRRSGRSGRRCPIRRLLHRLLLPLSPRICLHFCCRLSLGLYLSRLSLRLRLCLCLCRRLCRRLRLRRRFLRHRCLLAPSLQPPQGRLLVLRLPSCCRVLLTLSLRRRLCLLSRRPFCLLPLCRRLQSRVFLRRFLPFRIRLPLCICLCRSLHLLLRGGTGGLFHLLLFSCHLRLRRLRLGDGGQQLVGRRDRRLRKLLAGRAVGTGSDLPGRWTLDGRNVTIAVRFVARVVGVVEEHAAHLLRVSSRF